MSATRLVIFDLDGTLLDTLGDLAVSVNHALAMAGYPVHPLAAYRRFVGNGARELIARALPEASRDDATIDRLREDFKTHYSDHDRVLTEPYPGVAELVDELRRRGIALAVASNKYQAATDKLARHYFGPDTFQLILGQREGVPIKPDPAIVREILEKTGLAAGEAWYIGDSGVDMETAARAGVRSIGVTWGFRPRAELEEHGARYIVETTEDILRLITKYETGITK
jgi:phosphoglycolate phosphatase